MEAEFDVWAFEYKGEVFCVPFNPGPLTGRLNKWEMERLKAQDLAHIRAIHDQLNDGSLSSAPKRGTVKMTIDFTY